MTNLIKEMHTAMRNSYEVAKTQDPNYEIVPFEVAATVAWVCIGTSAVVGTALVIKTLKWMVR